MLMSHSSNLPVVDYTKKGEAILNTNCNCKESRSISLISNPVAIAVDYHTNNIYIANQKSRKVYVFNREANSLFNFGVGNSNRIGFFFFPASISIHNMIVYVKMNSFNRLFVFDLNGNFLTQIRIKSNRCDGFAIEQIYGDIYVCDNTNGEIHVLLNDYPFTYQFANGIVGDELDIQLTKDYIYVLSNKNPYLYLFNYDRTQIQTNISEHVLKQLNLPFGLAIDGAGNLFLCNCELPYSILILDSKGKILQKIKSSISKPLSITIDSSGRIIIVDRGNCIDIY